MKRTGFDYYFIGLLGVIAAVVAFKWQHLSLPFFWDEAWVYAPAVIEMHKNGLSLLPSAIPPELSRGHPLLFHFLTAAWAKIFGTGFSSLHSFSLLIAVSLLVAVYFFCKEFLSPMVGFLSALLLAVQPLFLAQSSFLLPEVMMALWTILTLYYFLKKKWILFFVFGSFMLLTKESGIVLLVALGVWSAFENILLRKEPVFKIESLKTYALIASPLLVAVAFLVLQKMQHGWFFYPEHIGMLNFNWEVFHKKLLDVYSFLFQGQGRYLLFISLFACITFLWKALNSFEKIFIPFGYLISTFILFNIWNAEDKISLFLLLIVYAKLFQVVFFKVYRQDERTGATLSVSALFIFLYFIFSQLNFLSLRYLMLMLPLIIIIVLGLMNHILEDKKWLFVIIAVVCIANCFRQIKKYEKPGDYDLSYVDAVKAEQQLVQYCEEQNIYEQRIYAGFNSAVNLSNPYAGYRNTENKFTAIADTFTSSIDYCILTNIEMRDDYDSLLNEVNLKHLTSFEHGKVWIDVYKFNGFVNDSTPLTPVKKRIAIN